MWLSASLSYLVYSLVFTPAQTPSPPPHSLSPFSVVSFTPYLVVSGQNIWYSCQHLNPVFSAEMTWAELLNVLTLYLTEESMKYCDPESGSNSNSQRDSTVPSLVLSLSASYTSRPFALLFLFKVPSMPPSPSFFLPF